MKHGFHTPEPQDQARPTNPTFSFSFCPCALKRLQICRAAARLNFVVYSYSSYAETTRSGRDLRTWLITTFYSPPPLFFTFGYCVFLYEMWFSPWVTGSADPQFFVGCGESTVDIGEPLGGLFRAFPFFLSATVRHHLEAEGEGSRKVNAGPGLFFVYCVSVRLCYPVPGKAGL